MSLRRGALRTALPLALALACDARAAARRCACGPSPPLPLSGNRAVSTSHSTTAVRRHEAAVYLAHNHIYTNYEVMILDSLSPFSRFPRFFSLFFYTPPRHLFSPPFLCLVKKTINVHQHTRPCGCSPHPPRLTSGVVSGHKVKYGCGGAVCGQGQGVRVPSAVTRR
jgi:hypothetical protein